MVYTRNPTWQDDPSTTTPITAAKLEHMEDGIVEGARAASETVTGNVELASAAEMTAGTDLTRPPSVKRVADYIASAVASAIAGVGGTIVLTVLDNLPISVPGVITWTGSAWPARTTVTNSSSRRVIWIGNPGGTGPTDRATNDLWTAG